MSKYDNDASLSDIFKGFATLADSGLKGTPKEKLEAKIERVSGVFLSTLGLEEDTKEWESAKEQFIWDVKHDDEGREISIKESMDKLDDYESRAIGFAVGGQQGGRASLLSIDDFGDEETGEPEKSSSLSEEDRDIEKLINELLDKRHTPSTLGFDIKDIKTQNISDNEIKTDLLARRETLLKIEEKEKEVDKALKEIKKIIDVNGEDLGDEDAKTATALFETVRSNKDECMRYMAKADEQTTELIKKVFGLEDGEMEKIESLKSYIFSTDELDDHDLDSSDLGDEY